MSAAFRDETGNAGFYHGVEPASGLNPVDLFNGSFRYLRGIVVLANSIRGFRGGEDGGSTLDRPRVLHTANTLAPPYKILND